MIEFKRVVKKDGSSETLVDLEGIAWLIALGLVAYFFGWSGAYALGSLFLLRLFFG